MHCECTSRVLHFCRAVKDRGKEKKREDEKSSREIRGWIPTDDGGAATAPHDGGEHGTGDAAAAAPRRRRSGPRGAPASEPQHPGARWREEEDAICGGSGGRGEGGREGGGGGGGAGVLRGREPARPGRGVRGPGVPAAHGGAGPGGGLLRRLHGLRQPRPPLRHRRHLRRRPLRRRRHLAPRVEGAAVPVQQGLQLLPLRARPAAAGADSDRVWPRLRGASDQTRGAGAGGHQGSHLDSGALP